MTELRTFELPDSVSGTTVDRILGRQLVRTWETDGIFQVAATAEQERITQEALTESRRFFGKSVPEKAKFVSDLTYSGYIASGEEVTAGEADFSEIFTVCPDVPLTDTRVTEGWPCHGPVPWPDDGYRTAMRAYLREVGEAGEKLLRLVALGLEVEIDRLTRLTRDGWHHLRVLRFPARSATTERGIGAHTDYGLLVIAAQDDVGGLFIRPPVPGEPRRRNWLPEESTAGMYQDDEPWHFVEPEPRVFTVFPGDILQFLTGGRLLSTPHKVRLATRERYTLAYFHEPSFSTTVRPLDGRDDRIHYGTHFTNMFTRCYPDRVTTQRIHEEGRLDRLRALSQ
ncbi:isopenicillin N synthase family dioxygenase [Amycolatopsis vastitatis]|uniref:isopenicillin N synthase family dioxygenase n=1 Tax=Amycolatopsis vastitatis TaxID=1905142 RepID=UPI00142D4B17|nr:isopenicillin N synthase family oxygenase [Amycolatopsis vastitatis]